MNGMRGLVIAIVAAFIVGCSAGMVGGILFTRFVMLPSAHVAARPGGPRHGGGQRGPGPMLGMLERRLGLTPDQRQKIEGILEDSRHGYATVRESTHAAIERELTPAQREQWRQLEERFPRERRRGVGRPHRRGDRP
jgi:Spy/CpxP family protein refolding chaperone